MPLSPPSGLSGYGVPQGNATCGRWHPLAGTATTIATCASLSVTWAGNASATDSSGGATVLVQASDDVRAGLTLTVTENGGTLYQGAYTDSLPLTLRGSGYQMVQVTVTDIASNSTSTEQGIYVQ